MVLLMDQVTERDIGWHSMTRRNRERPAKWHEMSLTVTAAQPIATAHTSRSVGPQIDTAHAIVDIDQLDTDGVDDARVNHKSGCIGTSPA